MAPGSCALRCNQLKKCTQSVQLNIGPIKVCAQVSTETPLITQFCLDQKMSEKEVKFFDTSNIEQASHSRDLCAE